MGRRRTRFKDLPKRMHLKGGTYYHVTTTSPRKWTALSRDYGDALVKWARLEAAEAEAGTFDQAAHRYRTSVIPTKATRTRKDNETQLDRLTKVFTGVRLHDIKPWHVREYLDRRGAKSIHQANREKALLSHLFNKAREWGLTDAPNPCAGVRGFHEDARDVYVSREDFEAVYAVAHRTVRDAMDLIYLTGQRPADAIKMTLRDIHDGHLVVKQNKTKAKLRIEVAGELKTLIDRLSSRPGSVQSIFLIAEDDGRKVLYWTLIDRFRRARAQTGATFQLRDLRAKAATDVDDIEHARRLLGHTTQKQTSDYIRSHAGQKTRSVR